jgi:hypothetical protein
VTGAPASTGGNPAVGSTSPTSTATCAAGTKLLGGGATVTQGSNARGAVSSSAPNAGGTAWTGTAVVTVTGGGTVTITAFALCGS